MKKQQLPAWFCQPPAPSTISDHGVIQLGDYLKGKSIAVLVTGSVAAMKVPLIVRALRRYGANTTVFASKAGLQYVTKDSLAWASKRQVITELTPKSEHLSGSKPFDCYLIAPASYNTINKVASGIADSVVTTTLASALGYLYQKKTQILMAPAMHGSMHNPLLSKSLLVLHKLGVQFIEPRQEFGKNNLPSQDKIVSEVCRATSERPLKDVKILVTGGPTPVKIDDIRRLTNCFSGKLGIIIAQDLFLSGADVLLLQAASGIRPPAWLPHRLYEDYDQYSELAIAAAETASYGIFSAAVADYGPKTTMLGKIPSGEDELIIRLEPLPKVIEKIRIDAQTLDRTPIKIISFKFEADADFETLRKIAAKKLGILPLTIREDRLGGHLAVIGNSNISNTKNSNSHRAYLFWRGSGGGCASNTLEGKKNIAKGIRELIQREESR